MYRTIKITGLLALGAVTALLLLPAILINKTSSVVIPAVILAVGLQSMAAFWALLWALPRSNGAFFSVFAGDALLRLAGLGVAAWWLWSRHQPYTAPLIILAFAYLLLSLVQIPFFYRAR